MTFVTFSNLILMALCVVVIVQSLRMAKGIREIRSSSLKEGVAQLDSATARAQAVLTELKAVLGTAMAAQNRALADGEALRDELSVVVGIGNAVAERIVDAAAAQNTAAQNNAAHNMAVSKVPTKEAVTKVGPAKKEEPAKQDVAPRRTGQRKPRSRSGAGRRKTATEIAVTNLVTADTPVAGHA